MVLHRAMSLGDVLLGCRLRAHNLLIRRLLGGGLARLRLRFLAALVARLLGRHRFHVCRLSLLCLLLTGFSLLGAFVLFLVMAPEGRLGQAAVMLLPVGLAFVGSLAGLGQRYGTQ